METIGEHRTVMKPEVALAVLERDECWLLQLRDDDARIVYPGQWGLFGGHLEPGEQPADAVTRELNEEIGWNPPAPLWHWFSHNSGDRIAHIFLGKLSVSIDQLCLQEGQEIQLVSLEQIRQGEVWSHVCQGMRPTVNGLEIVLQRWREK